MTEQLTDREFHEAAGVEDWRALFGGAFSHFRTGTFATGVGLVDRIAELADAANHHPDIDLRYAGVTVRLFTHDVLGLTERDLALARQISATARDLGIEADPSQVQGYNLTIDALDTAKVRPFWAALLGYTEIGDDDLIDPHWRGPMFWFQPMDVPRPERNRIHVDLSLPHDVAERRIAAAVAAGGTIVSDEHAPSWWTLADPEGNEVDVATWQGRS